MGKLAITINTEGIQTLSFFGSTEKERQIGLKLYALLEEELRTIDRLVKEHFLDNEREKVN
jgi:hypothetical protein